MSTNPHDHQQHSGLEDEALREHAFGRAATRGGVASASGHARGTAVQLMSNGPAHVLDGHRCHRGPPSGWTGAAGGVGCAGADEKPASLARRLLEIEPGSAVLAPRAPATCCTPHRWSGRAAARALLGSTWCPGKTPFPAGAREVEPSPRSSSARLPGTLRSLNDAQFELDSSHRGHGCCTASSRR